VSTELFVETKPIQFVPDRHLDVQAVVGATFAAPGRHGRIRLAQQDLCDGAPEKLHVAADDLVDPEAGVGEFWFAFISVCHILRGNRSSLQFRPNRRGLSRLIKALYLYGCLPERR